jgi:hypothetical protein
LRLIWLVWVQNRKSNFTASLKFWNSCFSGS